MLSWLACGEDRVPPGAGWLHPVETQRLAYYRFPKRRNEYLLRRTAGKLAVAGTLGWRLEREDEAAWARIGVLNSPGGAPYVVVDDRDVGLEVSLTDRAGQAVALIGPSGTARAAGGLGVDLEIVEPRSDGFVQDFLTSREQDWVRERLGDEDARAAGVNLVWSAKEAALKVQRVGLRADTRSVDVHVLHGHRQDGWSRLAVDHAGGVYPGWWRRDGVFLLTVATALPLEPPMALSGSADLTIAEPRHSWLADPGGLGTR